MTEGSFKRKLAVFSADVKGYSRPMGEDEEWTVRALNAYREAMGWLVQRYRGRVVDAVGDNLLAEFASVVDAVNCAVEIQRDLAERNAESPAGRKMEFRIGVNLGDVIEEGERICGDGVNIAGRLEALADPGGICISKTAFYRIETEFFGAMSNLESKRSRTSQSRWRRTKSSWSPKWLRRRLQGEGRRIPLTE